LALSEEERCDGSIPSKGICRDEIERDSGVTETLFRKPLK
jgi:hypothetical protein